MCVDNWSWVFSFIHAMPKSKLSSIIPFLDVLATREQGGNRKQLHEASLSRVWQHYMSMRGGTAGFAIFTSWRASNSTAKNKSDLLELKSTLRSHGLGFFNLEGHWQECQVVGVSYDSCPKDQLVDTTEPTLFVPEIDFDLFHELLVKYNQDAGIFAGKDTANEVTLYFTADGSTITLGELSPNTIAQAYSRVKGRPFVFLEYKAAGRTRHGGLLEQVLFGDVTDVANDDNMPLDEYNALSTGNVVGYTAPLGSGGLRASKKGLEGFWGKRDANKKVKTASLKTEGMHKPDFDGPAMPGLWDGLEDEESDVKTDSPNLHGKDSRDGSLV